MHVLGVVREAVRVPAVGGAEVDGHHHQVAELGGLVDYAGMAVG